MSNTKIVIFGVGETASLAYEYFTHDSPYEVVAFSVNQEFIETDTLHGLPIIPLEKVCEVYSPKSYMGFVAASSTKLNRIRKKLYESAIDLGYDLVSYISSHAFKWPNVKIGKNCFILENNTLQPFSEVGNNVVMWSGNHLGHRSIVKDHCFISSHCVISGFCEIGEGSFLGVNSTIEDHVVIAADNFIGARALIQKNTNVKSFYQEKNTDLSRVDTYRLFKVKE